MKLKQIGTLIALIVLTGCSKQSGQPAAGTDSSNQAASLALRNIYSIQVAGGQGAYLITELENTGKAGITAFQGKWTIKDDLDATVADQEVRYTSDTPFATTEAAKPAHVIAPGDKFVVIIQAISGQPDSVFATTKENIGNIGVLPLTMTLKESKLEDHRVTKKSTFAVEKIVTQ